jgi:hypothetical protein
LLGQPDLAHRNFGVFHQLRYGPHHWGIIRCLVFLGEWGEALSEIRAVLALEEKNKGEDPAWKALPIFRAWLHLSAMDFSGVVNICESMPASFILHSTNRERDVLWGSAETASGNHHAGLEHLMKAKQAMDREPMIFDWYLRMPLEAGLTELWLAKGDAAQARREARCFLEVALATEEHTFQALAWEANSRVSVAEHNWQRAEECIAKALSAQQGYDAPLAGWRVHATAASLFARRGDAALSQQHRELSQALIRKLADSLPPEEPLRDKFLAAREVRSIMASSGKSAGPKRARRSRAH